MKQNVLLPEEIIEPEIAEIEQLGGLDEITSLVERVDFLDVQLLRKFYMCGKEFPFDTQPHCFPILYREMKTVQKIKIGSEGLRKRLDGLVVLGLLEKVGGANPISYSPVMGKVGFVRGVITKFFLINGLMKFL